MKKKQWVAPSVVASFLLGSVMTAHVLYENNLLPSFRGIASEEVVETTVEAPQEVREVTLEELKSEIDKKIAEANEIKVKIQIISEIMPNEDLTSSDIEKIEEEKISVLRKQFSEFYTNNPVISVLSGFTNTNISFSEDVTDEVKVELNKKLSDAYLEANILYGKHGDHLYEDKIAIRISKLKDKELEAKLAAQEAQLAEANARVEDLKTRVCEQTNKIDTLIEKVEKLVEPAQDITDDLNYSYGLMDTFSMQNSMMGMFMNPFMMYSPFSMSMMSPYSMFSNPFSMSMMNPYMMGGYVYPGMGLGGYAHTGYRGVSELADHEKDYYGLANPTQKPRVNDSAFGVNYDDLRLGNDFAGNVDLNGGQTVMKIPQYSRSVANDVQTISVQ
ncbi:MAG: hypothetical protein EP319_07165 [Deltaproteobacteria bacterium]|nr:MAG: hypothetical protein EP319_07165 [Deltaproteobacteria bacterium]